jgi:hypothetical protein
VTSPVTGRLVRIVAALADHDRREPGDQGLAAAQGVPAALAGPVPLDRRPDQAGDLGGRSLALDVRWAGSSGRTAPGRARRSTPRTAATRSRVGVVLELGHQPGAVRRNASTFLVGVLEDRGEVVRAPSVESGIPARCCTWLPGSQQAPRSTPRCRRAVRSSRPRRPSSPPSRPAPHRSARPRRPDDHDVVLALERHRAMVANRTCSRQARRSLQGQRLAQRVEAEGAEVEASRWKP